MPLVVIIEMNDHSNYFCADLEEAKGLISQELENLMEQSKFDELGAGEKSDKFSFWIQYKSEKEIKEAPEFAGH